MTPQEPQDTAAQTAIADAKRLIANLELPYLEELQIALAKHIAQRRDQAMSEAAERIIKIAAAAGINLDELVATASTKGIKPKNAKTPKYRDHTPGSDKTWSGSGRRPSWVIAWIEAGGTLEELAI